jgi:protein gp37
MNHTAIEWVFNPDGTRPGWSWNPITGCLNGCAYCFARKLANGRLRQRYLANENIAEGRSRNIDDRNKYEDPFYPRFWPERLEHKAFNLPHKPCGILVCDMGELFGDWIPKEWQEQVFHSIRVSQSDRFYLLTKQPQNLAKFSPFPNNCWVGVTATNNLAFHKALHYLSEIEASVKYLSLEPLLNEVVMNEGKVKRLEVIDWVIIGAQTKPFKPPKVDWVENIVWACSEAKIPIFLKDNLIDVLPPTIPFYAPLSTEVPSKGKIELLYRQEYPR